MDTLDIFGIIFLCLCIMGVFYLSYYIMAAYSNELEKDFPGLKFAKLLIIFGMVLNVIMILTIPIDFLSAVKENNRGVFGFGFNIEYVWKILMINFITIYFLNIFVTEYYRSELEGLKRFIESLKKPLLYFLCYLSFVGIILLIKKNLQSKMVIVGTNYLNFTLSSGNNLLINQKNSFKIIYNEADLLTAFSAPFVLLGSLYFAIFSGMSLAFYPVELISKYIYRPVPPEPESHVYAKKVILKMSDELINAGVDIYDDRRKMDINPIVDKKEKKMTEKVLKNKVLELKRSYYEFDLINSYYRKQDNIIEENPLIYLAQLIVGIFFSCLSVLIFLHTLFSIKNHKYFLEGFFQKLSDQNNLFAILAYFAICFFVIFSILNSLYKMSLMFTSFLGYHNFLVNKTWVDTFLINNNIIMLCILGLIVFLMRTCNEYFSSLNSKFFFKDVVAKVRIITTFYDYRLTNILFLFVFTISIFTIFFIKEGKTLLGVKVEEYKNGLNKEKATLETRRTSIMNMDRL